MLIWILKGLYFETEFIFILPRPEIHSQRKKEVDMRQFVSRIWTNLTWLNYLILVSFYALADFHYHPSCIKKWCLLRKWSKETKNNHLASIFLIRDTLYKVIGYLVQNIFLGGSPHHIREDVLQGLCVTSQIGPAEAALPPKLHVVWINLNKKFSCTNITFRWEQQFNFTP